MDISHEIKVLSHLLRREFDSSEAKAYLESVTGSSGGVIGFIANADGDVFQRDIEARFSIRRSTASRMVQELEQKGILRRESVPRDARLKKLVLTERGMNMHRYVTETLNAIDRKLTDGIPEDELTAFRLTLEKMRANLADCKGPSK